MYSWRRITVESGCHEVRWGLSRGPLNWDLKKSLGIEAGCRALQPSSAVHDCSIAQPQRLGMARVYTRDKKKAGGRKPPAECLSPAKPTGRRSGFVMIDQASRGRREHSIETARIDRAQANRVCALSDKIACRRLRCLVRICSDLTLNVRARPEQGSN